MAALPLTRSERIMAAVKLKGNIRLTIDEEELTASVVFSADKDGEEWDAARLINHLTRNKVVEGYSPSSVEEVLGKLSKTKTGESEMIIAEGTKPEPPVPEQYNWEELPIPEPYASFAEKFFRNAPEPEIISIKIEKIKKRKKILIKQKLPFLPPKEEIVEVVEKIEVPERISVDPEVAETGWVTEGRKIATVFAFKPGKAGKSVLGLPIMPEQKLDADFYTGKGIVRKRGEFTAAVTGVLRRGKNWVEVLPFAFHEWEVRLSSDANTCLLDFTPGNSLAPLPSAEEIREAVLKLPYPAEHLLQEEELSKILSRAVSGGTNKKDLVLSGDKDSLAEIRVSEDKLKAVLHLVKGRGRGKPLSLREIGSLINERKLKNLNFTQIKTDIMAYYKSSQEELAGYLLCEGRAPDPGTETAVELQTTFLKKDAEIQLKKRLQDAAPDPAIVSLEEFPPDTAEALSFVVSHQPVGTITKTDKGKDGLDVYGNLLPCGESSGTKYKLFEHLKVEKDKIISEKSGILEKGTAEDGTLLLRVRSLKDAEIDVELAEDRMAGFLFIEPAEGAGIKPTLEAVRLKINESGITRGILEEDLSRAVTAAQNNESIRNLCIARGLDPIHETRNKIEYKIHFASGEKVTIRKDGRADYKTQQTITIVKKGDLVAVIPAAETAPSDGWDVTGRTIPAMLKQDLELVIGNNIIQERDEKGNVKLIAAKNGELLHDKKSLDIKDAHTIKGNVSLTTGNVKFLGSVKISGTVESGFQVIASQSIIVGEGVEGALLSAGKDIIINGGIKGSGKAILRTMDSIRASFAEQAMLLSVGDIIIKSYCLRTEIKCNGKLTLESEKGHLMGGHAKSRKGMEVMNLGSISGLKTQVSFGQDYLVADQIELEEKEIEKVNQHILKYDTFMHSHEKKGHKTKLEEARQEKLKFLKIIEKRTMRLFTLREKFEEHFPSFITVRGTVFPGTLIESHGRIFEVKKEAKSVTFEFDLKTGQIKQEKIQK
ncbi:MAG: DUF342 domain-containing protein [Spirochaetales bacterium]|nr:MAG: DUF342 domain-containing protein [Spirochaetales bacterium]